MHSASLELHATESISSLLHHRLGGASTTIHAFLDTSKICAVKCYFIRIGSPVAGLVVNVILEGWVSSFTSGTTSQPSSCATRHSSVTLNLPNTSQPQQQNGTICHAKHSRRGSSSYVGERNSLFISAQGTRSWLLSSSFTHKIWQPYHVLHSLQDVSCMRVTTHAYRRTRPNSS